MHSNGRYYCELQFINPGTPIFKGHYRINGRAPPSARVQTSNVQQWRASRVVCPLYQRRQVKFRVHTHTDLCIYIYVLYVCNLTRV